MNVKTFAAVPTVLPCGMCGAVDAPGLDEKQHVCTYFYSSTTRTPKKMSRTTTDPKNCPERTKTWGNMYSVVAILPPTQAR